jgi:hypothetical protein
MNFYANELSCGTCACALDTQRVSLNAEPAMTACHSSSRKLVNHNVEQLSLASVLYVDGVRLCPRIVTSKEPIVHPREFVFTVEHIPFSALA